MRFAFRQLWKSKGFALTAILTLALGIGANTAMFTLINAVVLKSLPVADPARLVRLGDSNNCCVIGGMQGRFSIFAYPLYTYLRDHTPEFEEMAAFQAGGGVTKVGVRRQGESVSEALAEQFVSGNYFSMFGIRPFVGRLLTQADDQPGAAPVAVISYRAWQHFAGAPVIGTTFLIDGAPFTIAGVAPPGFFGDTVRPDPPDFWVPLNSEPYARRGNSLLAHTDFHWLYIIGRLKPGVQASAIEPEVNTELRQWFLSNEPPQNERARQDFERQHITVTPAGGGVATLKQNYENDLRLLLSITALVLLIACANLANLQLARGASNAVQNSIRAALGASRLRLIRLTLAESVVLAIAGGAAGLFVAYALARLLIVFAFPPGAYIPIQLEPSFPVLAFTFVLAVLTGVIFGIAPAWSASRTDPAAALHGSGRTTGHRTIAQKSLVVLQAALSIILLTAAGLMIATLRNLEDQQFGFGAEDKFVISVRAGFSGYAPEKLAVIYRDLDTRLRQVPGVHSAGLALYAPMSGDNWQSGVTFEERPVPMVSPPWDRVNAGFFETMGVKILRGRVFDDRDTPNSVHVTVINQAFADKYFVNEDPIGKRFGFGDIKHAGDYEIVGVINNIVFRELREPAHPMFFLPLLQMTASEWQDAGKSRSNMIENIVLSVSGRPGDLTAQLHRAFAATDPNLTLVRIASMPDQIRGLLNHQRLLARLAELFGILALLLASVGLYGVTSYAVARRTTEIGIRSALGATRTRIVGLILRGALTQIVIGVALGIGSALAAGRILADQLYNVKSSDPWILILACLTVTACATAAALIPALRASAVDPGATLRA